MADQVPEDSMTPPPDLSAVPEYYPKVQGDIENILLQVININSDNILHEPTCMICSCGHRDEVEKKWLETKNHEDTKKVFLAKSSQPISNDVIDNHMRYHYEHGIKELQKIEYTNKIRRINSVELTTLDRIRLGLSMLTNNIMDVNSIIPNNDTSAVEVAKIKSAETSRLMMAFNQLLKLQASILGEMENRGELIIIPKQPFIDTFNQAIVAAKNNEEKGIINRLLKSLSELNKKTQ